jgi:hypothetical protein
MLNDVYFVDCAPQNIDEKEEQQEEEIVELHFRIPNIPQGQYFDEEIDENETSEIDKGDAEIGHQKQCENIVS